MRKLRKSPSVSSCHKKILRYCFRHTLDMQAYLRDDYIKVCLRDDYIKEETCQERARPYMMKAVVNQLKYLWRKVHFIREETIYNFEKHHLL